MPNIITSQSPLSPIGASAYGRDSLGSSGILRTLDGYGNTVDIIGNSIAYSSAIEVIGNTTYQYAKSIASNLCASLGQRLKVGNTFATGGITSSDVISDHLQQFLASTSKYGIFVAFENDIIGLSISQSMANAETIILACKKYGKVAVFLGPLPSFSFDYTAARDAYYQLSNQLQKLCDQYGFPYCNGFNLYGDYSAEYPYPKSGYTDASVHPTASTVINKIVNCGLKPIFDRLVPQTKGFPVGGGNPYNGVTNPGFNGTSGTLGTNASGTCPTSWTGHGYGSGNTAVFSIQASTDSDDSSPWFQGVYSGSTASSLVMASSSFSLSGSNFAVGDDIVASMEMEVVEGGTGFANIDLWVLFNGPGNFVYSNVDSVNVLDANPGRLVIASPVVEIPVGTTSMAIYGRFRGSGTIDFTGRVRHPSIIKQ